MQVTKKSPEVFLQFKDAARETGIRTCLCYEVSDRDGEEKAREAIRENEAFIRHVNRGTAWYDRRNDGHARTLRFQTGRWSFAPQVKPVEAGYHIHVAEGIEDLHHCLKNYGKRIIDRLMDVNILGPKH